MMEMSSISEKSKTYSLKDREIFIYGFGNPGMGDDGLGPLIAGMIEEKQFQGVVADSNYQLNIEDAYEISKSSKVIFVDASIDCDEPFSFYEISPSAEITFTTHSMHPKSVLALCTEFYNDSLKAYILAVRGYSFEFEEKISEKASENLKKAYEYLNNIIDQFLKEEIQIEKSV